MRGCIVRTLLPYAPCRPCSPLQPFAGPVSHFPFALSRPRGSRGPVRLPGHFVLIALSRVSPSGKPSCNRPYMCVCVWLCYAAVQKQQQRVCARWVQSTARHVHSIALRVRQRTACCPGHLLLAKPPVADALKCTQLYHGQASPGKRDLCDRGNTVDVPEWRGAPRAVA